METSTCANGRSNSLSKVSNCGWRRMRRGQASRLRFNKSPQKLGDFPVFQPYRRGCPQRRQRRQVQPGFQRPARSAIPFHSPASRVPTWPPSTCLRSTAPPCAQALPPTRRFVENTNSNATKTTSMERKACMNEVPYYPETGHLAGARFGPSPGQIASRCSMSLPALLSSGPAISTTGDASFNDP